jgi:hypothetical protein
MWPFKRKEKQDTFEVVNVPFPILIRQVIYDSVFEASEEIANMMGLPPISDEVSEMESRASQHRIDKFAPLLPIIDTHADISAQIASFAYIVESKREDKTFVVDEEGIEELRKLFKLISLSAAVSCISSLMNLKLLHTEVISDE